MAANRKLQGEIERCMKKVSEGVEKFEESWQKVHNATNANQKEKYEEDLKKEIKKLQRSRENIKSWIASGAINDKTMLLDKRKLIEQLMERFKVVEREAKTKAYSKEGLNTCTKVDPAERERAEICHWVNGCLESLNIHIDQFESELESQTTQKKKKGRGDTSNQDEIKTTLEQHREQVKKLEALLRMIDNETVTIDQVKDIKDDVEYYIDNCREPGFVYNDMIYEDIDGLDEVVQELSSQCSHNTLQSASINASGVGSTAGGGGRDHADTNGFSSVHAVTSSSSVATVNGGTSHGVSVCSGTAGHQSSTTAASSSHVSTPPNHSFASSTQSSSRTVGGTVATAAAVSIATAAATMQQHNSWAMSNGSVSSNMSPTSTSSIEYAHHTSVSNNSNVNNVFVSSSSSKMNGLSPAVAAAAAVGGATDSCHHAPTAYYAPVTSNGGGSAAVSTALVVNGEAADLERPMTSSPMASPIRRTLDTTLGAPGTNNYDGGAVSDVATPVKQRLSATGDRDDLESLTAATHFGIPQSTSSPHAHAASQHRSCNATGLAAVSNLKGDREADGEVIGVKMRSGSAKSGGQGKQQHISDASNRPSGRVQASQRLPTLGSGVVDDNFTGRDEAPRTRHVQKSRSRSGGHSSTSPIGDVVNKGGSGAASIATSTPARKTRAGATEAGAYSGAIDVASPTSGGGGDSGSSSGAGAGVVAGGSGAGGTSGGGRSGAGAGNIGGSGGTGTRSAFIPPLLGIAPLGPATMTKDLASQYEMLNAAYNHLPQPMDSERLRTYLARAPCYTPHYYPYVAPPPLVVGTVAALRAIDANNDFYHRLSTETLFFIFYYMEGTMAQFQAARALKKRSWRFHTKYMMWFQRHEEPKIINDEFEQGTYLYFDFEKWGQRKKEGFTFEYRFLEDHDFV